MSILNWKLHDYEQWNAKIVHKSNEPHVEIRTTKNDRDILIAVSLTGDMKLSFGNSEKEKCNVRISCNLPIKLDFDQWKELQKAIKEAEKELKKLAK